MKYTVQSMVWLAVYLLFVLLPLLALLVGSLPPARDFWTEFSAASAIAASPSWGCNSVSPRASGM
ncbi:hypothetical protein V5F32_00665 [Xanthobacter oligotrophicus]|uniref:Uncharacterized protein n=1 Tax=Xanthobacter oligotrophicus TaxID=2607286 RepID=A0ABW6ZSD5_9HYPH